MSLYLQTCKTNSSQLQTLLACHLCLHGISSSRLKGKEIENDHITTTKKTQTRANALCHIIEGLDKSNREKNTVENNVLSFSELKEIKEIRQKMCLEERNNRAILECINFTRIEEKKILLVSMLVFSVQLVGVLLRSITF